MDQEQDNPLRPRIRIATAGDVSLVVALMTGFHACDGMPFGRGCPRRDETRRGGALRRAPR